MGTTDSRSSTSAFRAGFASAKAMAKVAGPPPISSRRPTPSAPMVLTIAAAEGWARACMAPMKASVHSRGALCPRLWRWVVPLFTQAVRVDQVSQRCTVCINPARAGPRALASAVQRKTPCCFSRAPRATSAFSSISVARGSASLRPAVSGAVAPSPRALKTSSSRAVRSTRLSWKERIASISSSMFRSPLTASLPGIHGAGCTCRRSCASCRVRNQ